MEKRIEEVEEMKKRIVKTVKWRGLKERETK